MKTFFTFFQNLQNSEFTSRNRREIEKKLFFFAVAMQLEHIFIFSDLINILIYLYTYIRINRPLYYACAMLANFSN
jgi:hypothetical protein